MSIVRNQFYVEHHLVKDNGRFPNNNRLPVIIYRQVLNADSLLATQRLKNLLAKNDWSNTWRAGIFCYHHYHSNTHELLACCKGKTTLLLGGDDGVTIEISEGDVLIIPAGVAHKNLEDEDKVLCMGAYPGGIKYDMNYDRPGERPKAEDVIKHVGIPPLDPIKGSNGPLQELWK